MRAGAFLIGAIAFLGAGGVIALTAGSSVKNTASGICAPVGYKEVKIFGSVAGADNSRNAYLPEAKTGVPNAAKSQVTNCSDQKVTIHAKTPPNCMPSVSCYVKIQIEVTRQCCTMEEKKKYGCGPGQTAPTLTYADTFNGGGDVLISKCDARLLAAIDASAAEQSDKALRVLAAKQNLAPPSSTDGTQEGGGSTVSVPESRTPTTEEVASHLGKYGVPQGAAQEIARVNPQGAQNLLDALASKDPDSIRKAADELNNPLVLSRESMAELRANLRALGNSGSLTPEEGPAPEGAETGGSSGSGGERPSNTFGRKAGVGAETSRASSVGACGVDSLEGNFMKAESRCGYVSSNPRSSVRGPYHFLCPTWRAYADASGYSEYSDCSYRDDPHVSTQVMKAMNENFRQKYGDQCSSAGLSVSSCLYAIHVFGEGGFRKMLGAVSLDPNASAFSLCGSALSYSVCSNNRSIFSKGGTVAGMFGELDRRLFGGPSINTYFGPTYQGGSPLSFAYGSANGYRSYPIGMTFSPLSGPQFGSLSRAVFSPYYGFGQYIGSQLSQTPPQIQVPDRTQAPLPAVASLVAQSADVRAGDFVVITWTSLGMIDSNPCRLSRVAPQPEVQLSSGNNGTFRLKTATTTSATYVFSLKCADARGLETERRVEVRIR